MSNLSGSIYAQKNLDRVIKTLYIRPLVGKLRYDEIFSHFSAFGDVQSVRIYNSQQFSYGVVKFTQAEWAAEALQNRFHAIGGRCVRLATANDRLRNFASSLDLTDESTAILVLNNHKTSTLQNDVKTFLLDMNDDCFLEILSTNCLSVVDLCSIAGTCRRLKQIASRVFRRKFQKCDINTLSGDKAESAKRILMNFGSEITHLEITGEGFEGNWSRTVMNGVIEYCSNSLRSLDIYDLKISESFTVKLLPMFNNLRELKISRCNFKGDSKELFANCGSLVKLDVGIDDTGVLQKTFPKLQHFECRYTDEWHSLNWFIFRHSHLKLKSFKVENKLYEALSSFCRKIEIREN